MWHVSKCQSNVSIISNQTIWHVSRHLLYWNLAQKLIFYWTVQFEICAKMNEAVKNKPIEFYRRLNNDISNVRLNKFCLLGVCARWAHHIWHMYTYVNLRLLLLLLLSSSPIHLQPYRIWCARNERITNVFMFTLIAYELQYNKHAFRLVFFFLSNQSNRKNVLSAFSFERNIKLLSWMEMYELNCDSCREFENTQPRIRICQMSVLCKWKSARVYVCVCICVWYLCACVCVCISKCHAKHCTQQHHCVGDRVCMFMRDNS